MIYLKKGGLQFLHLFQKHKFEAHNTQIAQGFMIGLCRKTDETSQNVWRTSPVRTFGLQHVKQLMRISLIFKWLLKNSPRTIENCLMCGHRDSRHRFEECESLAAVRQPCPHIIGRSCRSGQDTTRYGPYPPAFGGQNEQMPWCIHALSSQPETPREACGFRDR